MESNQVKTSKRIAYIDALRGFTMFLVVFWHVMALSFGINASESVVGSFFLTFRMPMFFFISGYLGYKALDMLDGSNFKGLVKKKSFIQLVPTLIFFSLYQLTTNSSPLVFFTQGLTGYWFTLVLFELFITLYTLCYIIRHLGGGKTCVFIFLLLIALTGNALALWLNTRSIMPRFSLIFTLNNYFYYFQFFGLGCAIKAFPTFKKNITSQRTFCLSTIIFIILFVLQYKWITHDFNRYAYYLINSIVIKYAGLMMVFSMFSLFEDFFAKNGSVSKIMQFTGSRTLDIYLLHYFFLPSMMQYKYLLVYDGKESILFELFLVTILAISVMAICLLISTCLRRSPVLAKYLFGIIPKK